MVSTLLIGDHVLVDRISFAPPVIWAKFVHYSDVRRSAIIVCLKPGTPYMFLVKRTERFLGISFISDKESCI